MPFPSSEGRIADREVNKLGGCSSERQKLCVCVCVCVCEWDWFTSTQAVDGHLATKRVFFLMQTTEHFTLEATSLFVLLSLTVITDSDLFGRVSVCFSADYGMHLHSARMLPCNCLAVVLQADMIYKCNRQKRNLYSSGGGKWHVEVPDATYLKNSHDFLRLHIFTSEHHTYQTLCILAV